jgi:hypothetical protein
MTDKIIDSDKIKKAVDNKMKGYLSFLRMSGRTISDELKEEKMKEIKKQIRQETLLAQMML